MDSAPQKNILRHCGRLAERAATLKRWGLGLFFVLLLLISVFYTRAGAPSRVYASPSNTLNFQARLLTGAGAIVPDGNYSVQFKLYNAASGGTAQWTETQGSVSVKSGYLSVYLGSVTSFPGTIDWSQQEWLTMNVNSDGEMSPRLLLTSVPNAFHANEADALRSGSNLLTANNFAQLGPSSVQTVNLALAALRINQTGAGGLIQFQSGGSDIFTVANNGDLVSGGSGTFSGGTLTLGSATQLGGLVLNDGAGKTGTIKTTALGANRTYTFPDANGTVCLTTTCSVANAFLNGGNSFGAAASLGTNDNFNLSFRTNNTNQLTLDTSGNLDLLNGGLKVAGTTVLTTGKALQNLTGVTSSGSITFSGLNTAGVVHNSAAGLLSTGAVVLGTDTTGNYVASLGSLTGLTTTGNSGAGSTPSLSVTYGSGANTAVQGNTTLTCASGTGNLTGGGTSITLGTGGTCGSINTVSNPSFSGLVTASSNTTGLVLSGTPTNSAASSLLQIGSAIAGGNTATNGGTYLGLNEPSSGAGSAADFLNFQVNGTTKLKVTNAGLIDSAGGLAISGTSVLTSSRALQNLTGISTTGNLVFNSFSSTAGLLQVDASGNVSIASAGSGYEVPLTFNNGLTRTSNTIKLGGALTGLTDIALSGNDLVFSGTSGNVGIGISSSLGARLHINTGADANRGLVIRQNSNSQSGDLLQLQKSDGTYLGAFQGDGLLNLGVVNGTGVSGGVANTVGDKILLWANGSTTRFGFGIQPSTLVAYLGGASSAFAIRVDPGTGQGSSGTNVFSVSGAGNVLGGTYNTNTFSSTALTFGGAGAAAIQAANNQNLTVQAQGTGSLTLNTGSGGLITTNVSTIRRTASGATTFDLQDGSDTTFAFTNSGAGNLNLTVDGSGQFGTGLTVQAGGVSITGNTSIASGTFTSSGGLIKLNDSSNFGTSINTGSSTGTITLGGGSAPLSIDSTAFDVNTSGNISTPGTYNGNTFTSTQLTFGGASGSISTTGNGNLTVGPAGSGVLALNTGTGGTATTNISTLQRTGATGMTLDLNNAGTTAFTITNSDASNVANLSVEGGIAAGTNSAFSVNTDGDVTGGARQLDGSSTANGGSGLGSSTSLTLVSATNFDVGNYVRVTSANCGGTGINPCYAKITAKATNTLTIAPALTWTNGSAVVEFHFPEIGGVDTSQNLLNRYGRGYFISGVATGNGTTYYNEDSITTSLSSFDLLNTGVTTLNIGGAATTLNIGSSGTTVNVQGNLQTAGSQTITAGGGLTVSSGGANITGNTTVSSGTFTSSGGLVSLNNNANFGTNINTGTSTGTITIGGGSSPLVIDSTNFDVSSSGALSGITTINASGAITAATSTNTINGLVINSGVLSGVTGITFTSGSLNLNSGGLTNGGAFSGLTTLSLSGAITGATSGNTINGLIINSGALSGITGMTFTSGSLNLNNGGITNAGSITGVGTNITANAGLTIASTGSNALTLQGNSASLSIGGTSGNVGVGTGSPSAALHVSSAASGTALLKVTDGTATAADVFTIADEGATTFQNRTNSTSAFDIKNAAGNDIIKVDTTTNNTNNLVTNPSIESAISGNWALKGSATVTQDSTDAYYGSNSLRIQTTTTGDGAKQNVTLASSTTYTLVAYARSSAGNMTTLEIGRSENGSTDTACLTNQTVYKGGWTRYSCTFTTGTVSGGTYIYVKQTDATARSYINIDAVILQTEANNTPAYREGQISLQGSITSPLTIQNSSNSNTALQVLSSKGANVFDVGTTDNNIFAGNAGFEVNASGWAYSGTPGSVTRDSTQAYTDSYSEKVVTTANANNGLKFVLANGSPVVPALSTNTTYTLSWYAKLDATSAAFTDMIAAYARDGSTETNCTGINTQTVVSGGWTRYSCQIVTDGTTPAAGAYIVIKQTGATAHTFYVDSVQLETGSSATAYGAGTIFWNATITSPATFRAANDSTTAFQIQNSAGSTNLFTVDTLNSRVGIGTAAPTQTLDVIGNTQASGRFYVPGTSGTNGQGYFVGTATTPLGGFQSLDLSGNTYSFFGTNKYFNGTAWVDNGLGRVGSSFQIQNDAFTFYSFDTAANFTPRFTVASGGNVGVGTSGTPGALLSVGGTTGNFLVSSTGAETSVGLTSGGALVSLNNNANFNTNINTGTSTGTVTIGGGSAPLVIDSTNFDVSSAGALSGITTINASGLATISGGATISGAAISLNNNSNSATNINTGTSTGTVTIGGGSTPLVISSTHFAVTSAGALSGITTITASGNINTTGGVYQQNGVSGISVAACGAAQYIGNGVTLNGGIITAGSCHADGLSDQRLKTNIVSLDDTALSKINQVNAVTFDFKCDDPNLANKGIDCAYGSHHTGVIAQELAKVFPGLVFQDENGYYNVRYQELSIYTLKALQELSTKVDGLNPGAGGSGDIKTGGTLRLDSQGKLQNITGLNLVSGGASFNGGVNNNNGGFTNVGTLAGATTIDAQSLTLHAAASGNILSLTKDTNGVFTIFNNGAMEVKLDAKNAFSVKKANGDDVFNVSTSGGLVQVGSAANDDKAILLVLDHLNIKGDPAGVNGAQYYNSSSNKFRCYQNDKWQDCLSGTASSEYVLSDQTQTWQQPLNETEFPGEPRTWVDLTLARELRLTARLNVAGATTAACRLQYADGDDGPWKDLTDQGSATLDLKASGSLKTDWATIKSDARKEVLIRVVCTGGNYNESNTSGAVPKFGGIKLQIR